MIYLLTIYILFIVIYAVYSALAIYHLWRFGYVGDLTKPAILYYLIISAIIIIVSIIFISTRPWPIDFNV